MYRTVTPGMFIPGFARFRYHDHRQGGQALRLSSCYGVNSLFSPKSPELRKPVTLSTTPVSFYLPHCLSLETYTNADLASLKTYTNADLAASMLPTIAAASR
jgi:hypothetical protein